MTLAKPFLSFSTVKTSDKNNTSTIHKVMILKICGLSDPENIREVSSLHPDMMGFIFYAPSPRNACALLHREVRNLPEDIDRVGVFVDAPVSHVLHLAEVEKGLTPEEWKKWKESFFGAIFFKMALDHEDVKEAVINEIAPKIYEELRQA